MAPTVVGSLTRSEKRSVCVLWGHEELSRLDLREVTDGGKIWILAPRDPGVFQTVRRVQEFPLVCDAQIYLDLLQVGLRGSDQAKALREWKGFCRP